MIRIPASGSGSRWKWRRRGRRCPRSWSFVLQRRAAETNSSSGSGLAGQPAFDLLAIGVAKPAGTRGRAVPMPIVSSSIRTTGTTSLVVPTRITSSAAFNSGKVTCELDERDLQRLDQPEDELPGHARQDFGALGRPLEPALPDPEQRGVRRLGHEARGIDQDRLVAARAASGLGRQDSWPGGWSILMSQRFQRRSGWLITLTPVSRSRAVGPSS